MHAFPVLPLERRVEPVEFMGELLAKAALGSLSVDEETALQETLDMMSCRAAVKAGDRLNDVELTELLRRREEAGTIEPLPARSTDYASTLAGRYWKTVWSTLAAADGRDQGNQSPSCSRWSRST